MAKNNDVILRFLDKQSEESGKFLDEKGEEIIKLIKDKKYASLVDEIPDYLEKLIVHSDNLATIEWFKEDYIKRGVEY